MSATRWSPAEVQALVDSQKPVLVDLRADWCPQCGPQEQVVERLSDEYADRVHIGSLDVGIHTEYADEFSVQGLPAFLLFNQGVHQDTINGYQRAPQLRAAIRTLLAGP